MSADDREPSGMSTAVLELLAEIDQKADLERERKKAADPNAWGEPEPFGALDVPPFPVEALATWQRDWATAEAEFCQVPIDLPSMLCLASASFAVSRGSDVEVRPGWNEPTNVWAVCSAPPGERKSPVFEAATRPIFAYQLSETERTASAVAERQRERRIIEGQMRAAEDAAIKGKQYGGQDARRAANELQAHLSGVPEISPPVLLADDVTPEAVARVLASNGERLGIFSAEGGPFEMMGGRYADKGTNLEIWLKCHSGDPHVVHRIKRDPIFLKRPLVSIAITTQPAVIAGLATRDGFRARGLLARFFYSLPKTTLGLRASEATPVPEPTRRAYGEAMIAILDAGCTPRLLTMSAGADRARSAFQTALEPRLGIDGDLSPIADWAAKLVGLVARLAGVLHVADHAASLPKLDLAIPVETWFRAQTIGEYALDHARAAFDVMGSDDDDETAKRVWAWIQRRRELTFSQSDARRAIHATAETIEHALDRLTQRALVRRRPAPPSTGGRPPSPTFDVNPKAVRT